LPTFLTDAQANLDAIALAGWPKFAVQSDRKDTLTEFDALSHVFIEY